MTRRETKIISNIPIWYFFAVSWYNLIYITFELYEYPALYYYSSELINCSVVFSLFLLFICRAHKLCVYNWIASSGLLFLNAFNLFSMSFLDYSRYLNIVVMVSMALFSLIAIILFYSKNET